MSRLIDGDALKNNMFSYAAPEMVWDMGDIEHKIDEQPTIEAIPVEWLKARETKYYEDWGVVPVSVEEALTMWQKEQEAQDG